MNDQAFSDSNSVWAVVGSIVSGAKDSGTSEAGSGTRQFRPGARVYIIYVYRGIEGESALVMGLPRRSRKYIQIVMRTDYIENIRLKRIYKPAVVNALLQYFSGEPEKEYLEHMMQKVKV